MAMRRPGIYAALSAHYFDDVAVMEAGEDAELLYIRMLAYAARQPENEGFIHDRVIASRLGIVPRESGDGTGNVPGTDAGSRAGKLAEVGLLTREGGGYRITAWLKWNKSAEEMGRERTRDQQRKQASVQQVSGNGTGNGTGNAPGTGTGTRRQRSYTDQIRSDESSRADVTALCDALSDGLRANGVKHTVTDDWRRTARLMIDRDNRPPDEAHNIITFATTDEFWKTNIHSMGKLREQYDKLRLQMERPQKRNANPLDKWQHAFDQLGDSDQLQIEAS